jgi:hypothetical protein
MDDGEKPVTADAEKRRLRDAAVRIHRRALILAAAVTAAVTVAPPY